RALGNLPALAVVDARWRPRWAVLAWAVPVLNVVRPKQVMDDLWRASAEDLPLCSPDWRRRGAPALSAVWWATLLTGAVLSGAGLLVGLAAEGSADRLPEVAALLDGVAALMLAGSLLSLHALVRLVDGRQARRAQVVADPSADPSTDPFPESGSESGPGPGSGAVAAGVAAASVELETGPAAAPIPTRHEPLVPLDAGAGARRTSALRL